MEAKTIFILNSQKQISPKYPTLKKSQESKKDIAFRLNFSPIKKTERNIKHVLDTFDKPFASLGIDSELRSQFANKISDLKNTFQQIQTTESNDALNELFWKQWNEFDVILHQISIHSAYYYCSREIERFTLDITGAIKSIKSNPPGAPGMQHDFSILVEKIQAAFVQIVDRFREIVDSKIEETKKIRDLESMRNQIRQFRTDITGEWNKFFSLSSASHSSQDKARTTIEKSLTTIVTAISDLKRQTYLLDNLDSEIINAMRVIEMMIDGDPLPNARSKRIQEESSKLTKENIGENNADSPLSKPKQFRRCTINPKTENESKITKRSSRRRQSIKRNSLLIDLGKSESESSFCSTLSEFQDGKELLFDSNQIHTNISDQDEDAMYQLSDNESGEEYDNNFEDNSSCEIPSIEESQDNNPIEININDPSIKEDIQKPSNNDIAVRIDSLHTKSQIQYSNHINGNIKEIRIGNNIIPTNDISDIVDEFPTATENDSVSIANEMYDIHDMTDHENQNNDIHNQSEKEELPANLDQPESKDLLSIDDSTMHKSDSSIAGDQLELLSSEIEEIRIPLTCSCPLLTLDQCEKKTVLDTSSPMIVEVVTHQKFVVKRNFAGIAASSFLLICFILITLFLLMKINYE